MMTGTGLSEAIRIAMGFPLPLSAQLIGWGTGVVAHIQSNGTIANAPGTINGTCPPSGGPLTGGSTSGGTISGMSGPGMASDVKTAAGYPSISSELSAFCQEIVDHIELFGVVTFFSGVITGTCTNTLLSPGPLTGGAGTGGLLSGLNGNTLADAVHASLGFPGSTSDELKNFCNAVTNYIETNSTSAYAAGSVVGTCPPGGGPLVLGTGTSGTIT